MERYVIEIVAVKRTRDVPLARHGPQDSSVSLPLTNTYGSFIRTAAWAELLVYN